jgi:ribosome biogenesis protein Nip4
MGKSAAKLKVVRRAPENESKRDRFRRLAPKRVSNALKRIRHIGNLSAAAYESTEQERAKIVKAVSDAVAEMQRKLEQRKESQDEFTF